jgi:anaerobic selenocysteine-containing dehydrogenase
LTTRRGKQFNSMIFRNKDPLTGNAGRTTVFLHEDDAADLGVTDGDPVRVLSDIGEMEARVKTAPLRRRTLQAFWPEANILVPRSYDPISGEPDYNVFVRVQPL